MIRIAIRPEDTGIIHFVGIGGVGMSGIAEILHSMEYTVQGSDVRKNANTERLERIGIRVHSGHRAVYVDGSSMVVFSSAIDSGNVELTRAEELGLPIVPRAEMLAELMRLRRSVAVGGTHGKTTTTSLIAALLEAGGFDPTVVNGGIINAYGTNARLGSGEWLVAEADESDGSFVRLPATVAVVTSMDLEHMEHYKHEHALEEAFLRFVENIPFYGFSVLCLDHARVRELRAKMMHRRIITYGFSPQADVRIQGFCVNSKGSSFDLSFRSSKRVLSKELRGLFLPMFGRHNVANAAAAIAVADQLKVPEEKIRSALGGFAGVRRRFTQVGQVAGITVIDDYAHHPVEIRAVLQAARNIAEGRIFVVLQPHRYSRLSALFRDFCVCLDNAEQVLVTDVYAAGEQGIAGVSGAALAEGLSKRGHRGAVAVRSGFSEVCKRIADEARNGDMVLFLGAGDITAWAKKFPKALEAILRPPEAHADKNGP